MARLSKADIDLLLNTLDGWTLDGDAIRKEFTL